MDAKSMSVINSTDDKVTDILLIEVVVETEITLDGNLFSRLYTIRKK